VNFRWDGMAKDDKPNDEVNLNGAVVLPPG
jgi:hypothetical protein